MKTWIRKLFGASNENDAAAKATQTWLDALAPYLESLESVQTGLGSDVVSYLTLGAPLSVIVAAQSTPAVNSTLQVCQTGYGSRSGFDKNTYKHFVQLPLDIQLRWARLLEACAATNTRQGQFQMLDKAPWLEVLLKHSCGLFLNAWSYTDDLTPALTHKDFERLLEQEGLSGGLLLKAAFASPVDQGYYTGKALELVTRLVDYPDALEKYASMVQTTLLPAPLPQRMHVLTLLKRAKASTLLQFSAELVELATVSSKQVRMAAERYVLDLGTDMAGPLRVTSESGKPEQRLYALDLLHRIAHIRGDQSLLEEARQRAANDKAPSVQALIPQWDASAEDTTGENDVYDYQIPVIDWQVVLTPEIHTLLKDVWAQMNAEITKANRNAVQHHQAMLARGQNYPLRQIEPFSDDLMTQFTGYLESPSPKLPKVSNERTRNWPYCWQGTEILTADACLTPVLLYKFLQFFDVLGNAKSLARHATFGFNRLHALTGRPTLLELAQLVEIGGDSPTLVLNAYCNSYGEVLANDWEDSDVWPFVAHHIDLVTDALVHGTPNDYSFNRQGLFRAIATLPRPPAKVVNALFSVALGSGKTDRLPAQNSLAQHPDKENRIVAALADGKSEIRIVAAQWLARIGYTPAVPALETALKKEKQDHAKAAFLDALQALGSPIDRYLDRNALAVEAAAFLKKGLPKELSWFPWDALPVVRWADTKTSVPIDILRWMLGQAVKSKSPEPNAILQKYCGLFEEHDKENFGQFVLETWLQEDVRPIDADEALKRAQQQAQWVHSSMTRSPQYYQNDPNLGRSVEELTGLYLPGFQRTPAGSAIASKGILAVVGACAGARAAAVIGRYLKEWYGSRAAQGKALIATLAWIEHPTATQLMLSVGSRFRTKSFQEEATRQAEALAERKGWTLSELADRTIPSAGFDENGVLELSYGNRVFTARLLPDYRIELFNPEGKAIKSLPDPRQDDDEELAKAAKKTYSTAKKEIKSVIDLQTLRLYEALCIERDWAFEDWNLYLNHHPLMRRLLQRLVWVHCTDDQVVSSFRPMDDGSLTDLDDNEVLLQPTDRVQLAHETKLSADEIAGWQRHFVDYEITPLFPQFGKGTYVLPEQKAKADKIEDFKGYLIETFALRNRALKLGYTRGQAEDAGWFYVYQKRFPTLGIEAVLEFTGNTLPEENRTVALLNLSFTTSGQHHKLPLASIPKVLLSECYGDLRALAADGSGFDAEWEKKSEY